VAFWRKRPEPPPTPATIAKSLYSIIVAEGTANDIRKENLFGVLPGSIPVRIVGQLTTYRKAAVLLALLARTDGWPRGEEILQAYEALIFGPSPTDQGVQAMTEVRSAMIELEQLLRRPDPQLTWAREWLARGGVTTENPAVLAGVCIHWMGVIDGASRSVDAFKSA
jgi:hypothetical protein